MLLAGERGSGKSTTVISIAKRLAADPNHVYLRIVNCRRMVGVLHSTLLIIIILSYYTIKLNLPHIATSLTARYQSVFMKFDEMIGE